MTPTALDRIVRSSLAAILQGDGDLPSRMDQVATRLEVLSLPDRKRVTKVLKIRLSRAIRQKTATVVSATTLPAEAMAKIRQTTDAKGMVLAAEVIDPELLAGYTILLGDDRTDHSLRGRLEKLRSIR